MSITLESSKYDGRYMKLECTQTPNGSAKNSSNIAWKLSSVGGNENYYDIAPTTVVINGKTVYSSGLVAWESKKFPAKKGYVEGEIEVTHNNDGTKTITVELSTRVYYHTAIKYEKSWTLTSIPRYALITSYTLTAESETSVKISSSSDVNCDLLQYSINGGAWKDGPYYNSTIKGLSPNTAYNIKIRLRRSDSGLWTESDSKKATTYDYPHCISAPDFVIGQAVTLKFYNPLGREFDFILYGNDQHIWSWTGIKGTSYTGINGEPAVTGLYDSIKNTKSAKYSIETVYNNVFKPVEGGTYRVDESKCAPIFTTFTYKDTNATVTAVTGNNQVLVKGLSTLSVEIKPDNGMEAINSATGNYYSANIDTLSKTKSYSDTALVTIPVGTVTSAGTKRLDVRAYDSRGISTLVSKDVVVYDYYKPKLTVSAVRLNNFENTTTIEVSGEYSRLTIGGTDKNTVKSVGYRIREKGGTWPSAYTTITATLSAGKITINDLTLALDNTKAWEIEVKATDNLSSNTATDTVNIGQAIFFISTNKETCFIKNNEVATKRFVADAIGALATGTIATEDYVKSIVSALYPAGTVICTATNKNPSTIYGGTWVLIDKGFASHSSNNADYFTADTNVTSGGTWVTRAGQTVRIRQNITINASITDTGLTLGTFNFGNIGISKMSANVVGAVTYSDGANGGIAWNINETTGELTLTDVFDLTPIPTGNTFCLDITFPLHYSHMLDSACDKFYWKRTA